MFLATYNQGNKNDLPTVHVLFVDTRHESASTVGGGEPAVRDDDRPVLRLRLVHHGAARQEARLALHAPLPHAAQVLRQPPGKAALCNITLLGRNFRSVANRGTYEAKKGLVWKLLFFKAALLRC